MTRWIIVLASAVLLAGLGSCARRRSVVMPRTPTVATYARTQCYPECSPGFSCERGVCVHPCNPACSPGWACSDGSCVPLCNPPCASGFHCGEQRTCEAGPPRPARTAEATQEWMPAPPEPAPVTATGSTTP